MSNDSSDGDDSIAVCIAIRSRRVTLKCSDELCVASVHGELGTAPRFKPYAVTATPPVLGTLLGDNKVMAGASKVTTIRLVPIDRPSMTESGPNA